MADDATPEKEDDETAITNDENVEYEDDDPNDPGPDAAEPKSDDHFFEQLKHLGAMCEVERKREDLEHQINDQSEVVKTAKKGLDEASDSLKDLKDELADATAQLLDLNRQLLYMSGSDVLPKESSEQAGWRERKTSDLLDGVKGLGKKLEALVDVAPTVGDLEDLRKEASVEHVEFQAKLPAGCGKKVAQAIEDRLLDHIASFNQAAEDPDRVKLADELLEEVRNVAEEYGWTSEDCIPTDVDDEHIHSGFTAYENGQPYTAMDSLDREKARQWMTGWVGAERLVKLQAEAA